MNGKVAQVRMPNMWRRDILVTVPVAFLANVSAEWKAEAAAKLKRETDPLNYLDRQLHELRERGLESFDAEDPVTIDFQIKHNHIWFAGIYDEAPARREGFDPLFVGNVWTAKVPVLLMHREAFKRSARTQDNPNLIAAEFFKERIPRKKRKMIQDVKLCYRGVRYQPTDLWHAARSAYENWEFYQFRRGHLVPMSIQFTAVPELGVELEVGKAKARRGSSSGGRIPLVTRTQVYALPLVPASVSPYIQPSRWGLLSAQYIAQGTRQASPLAVLGPDQVSSLKGE
jgi:hypothetical protein